MRTNFINSFGIIFAFTYTFFFVFFSCHVIFNNSEIQIKSAFGDVNFTPNLQSPISIEKLDVSKQIERFQSSNNKNTSSGDAFLTFHDDLITIQYPSNWFVNNNTLTGKIVFQPPQTKDARPVSLEITIDQIKDENIDTLDVFFFEVINYLRSSLPNFSINSMEKREMIGDYKLVFSYEDKRFFYPDSMRKKMLVMKEQGPRGETPHIFIFEYSAHTDQYKKYLPQVQEMINSFRMSPSNVDYSDCCEPF